MNFRFAVLLGLKALLLNATALAAGPAPSADGLAAYRGKVTYVDFWASWCTPCAESFPWLNRMQEKYAKQGLQIVGVGLDAQTDKAERFLKVHPARFELLKDPEGKLAEKYGVEGMPYALILDAEGRVLHRHAGYRAAEAAAYESIIQVALDDKSARSKTP